MTRWHGTMMATGFAPLAVADRARRARLAQLRPRAGRRCGSRRKGCGAARSRPRCWNGCAAQIERQLERPAGAGEVLGELPRRLADRRVGVIGLAIHHGGLVEKQVRDACPGGLDVEGESRRGVNRCPRHTKTSLGHAEACPTVLACEQFR